MEATVTIICGCLLGLMQCYTNYRLKEQDNARDAARAEMALVAANVKTEAQAEAHKVATKVEDAAEAMTAKVEEIHVIVNSRQSEMIERMQALEAKLGLSSGEEIPSPQTITKPTA